MKTVKILEKARGLLEKGWVQGRGYDVDVDGNICYCAVSAWQRADPRSGEWLLTPALGLLLSLVPEAPKSHLTPVAAFNDNPKTKKEDVLALYDWAIGIELAGGL